jgi:hypothetical protein
MQGIVAKKALIVLAVVAVFALMVVPAFVAQPSFASEGGGKAAEAPKHERPSPLYANPMFWFGLLAVGVAGLFVARQMNMLDNTVVAVVISLLIAVSYFHIVDHYLMDMQGLDYWYLFRG